MESISLSFWGDFLAIAVALVSIVFCFLVYWQYRMRKSAIGWLVLSFSLVLMLVRRLRSVASANDAGVRQFMAYNEWAILVAISMLQLYAFWKILGAYGDESKSEYEAVGRLFKLREKQMGKPKSGRIGEKK